MQFLKYILESRRKMKKILITSLAFLFALLIGSKNVSALASIELLGPDVYSGKTTSNDTDTFTVFGESSVQGSRPCIFRKK